MGKKVVGTSTQTSTKTHTEADGTVVDVITTVTTEKYDDGSTGTKTETKTVKKPPGHSNGHKNTGNAQLLNPNLTPATSDAPKTHNTTDKQFIQDCLQTHNKLRAKHGSPPLTLDENLGKIAQAWANELAKKGTMQHNTTGFGENVYWNTESPPGNRPADAWYSEIKDFNFNKLENQKGTGHFTQLIWKSSTVVGIAMQQGPKGYFVVANYHPPGNIVGRFPENIKK